MNINKAKIEFVKHAKEDLDVQEIGGTLYAFGSELACLRLVNIYGTDKSKASYSLNRKSWYFSLEMEYSH